MASYYLLPIFLYDYIVVNTFVAIEIVKIQMKKFALLSSKHSLVQRVFVVVRFVLILQ